MYGLVNKAIEDMVCVKFGKESWEKVREKAEVDVSSFLSTDTYPDDITHRLIKAASELLNISPREIMEAFGEYWVKYTVQEGYGEMIDMSGDTLPEFLLNLDNMHARVGLSFPQIDPPSFDCTDMEAESLKLHYYSHRQGLSPIVIGMVKSLGDRFETEVEITHTESREQGAEHDEFLIKYKEH